ncbi:uncharacterized protein BO72DRAFT_283895 [Aspergillus fijiensis CBS 313.89]|uniref:Uncharacterized protein n=1 Tax=Aspergillus fijiensis CBS 313.89 TaxID=1448319 RepID=A0A8G1W2K8_9EURO|nr:uncharacterized protein BO72DRAFT_283895 [Aspergillus fijiensis CBS 313.89]RAK80566.1 hypothetical protein BO72DRAFT_283895 [Aspergillus fijiensis CBS 313.89]
MNCSNDVSQAGLNFLLFYRMNDPQKFGSWGSRCMYCSVLRKVSELIMMLTRASGTPFLSRLYRILCGLFRILVPLACYVLNFCWKKNFLSKKEKGVCRLLGRFRNSGILSFSFLFLLGLFFKKKKLVLLLHSSNPFLLFPTKTADNDDDDGGGGGITSRFFDP